MSFKNIVLAAIVVAIVPCILWFITTHVEIFMLFLACCGILTMFSGVYNILEERTKTKLCAEEIEK